MVNFVGGLNFWMVIFGGQHFEEFHIFLGVQYFKRGKLLGGNLPPKNVDPLKILTLLKNLTSKILPQKYFTLKKTTQILNPQKNLTP